MIGKSLIKFKLKLFKDFVTAFEFMQEISKECIRINHPNWTNSYNRLKISLFTHDYKKSLIWILNLQKL